MKKIVLVLQTLVLTFGLCACGGGSDETASSEAESQFPMTVEDNDNFTFEIVENDDLWGDYTVKITNKTDQDFTFSCDNAVVNEETTIDMFIYSDIAAGTSAKDTFYLSQDDIGDYEEGTELSFAVDYKLINSDFDEIGSGTMNFTITI